MIDEAPDVSDEPAHTAWHTRHTLADPGDLLVAFWDRVDLLSRDEATQILLAARECKTAPLIAARRRALALCGSFPLELEMDEFRLREAVTSLIAREPEAVPDEVTRITLTSTLHDALLALAAVQTATSLGRTDYIVLMAPYLTVYA